MNTRETKAIRRARNKVAHGDDDVVTPHASAWVRPSMNGMVTLAERLVPLICELRHSTENDRRIAEPIVQAVRESGLCRMLLDTGAPPRCKPQEWLTVLETLAGAEASVSWLIWNNTLACFWSRFLNDDGRERIFGDSSRLFAGSRPDGP